MIAIKAPMFPSPLCVSLMSLRNPFPLICVFDGLLVQQFRTTQIFHGVKRNENISSSFRVRVLSFWPARNDALVNSVFDEHINNLSYFWIIHWIAIASRVDFHHICDFVGWFGSALASKSSRTFSGLELLNPGYLVIVKGEMRARSMRGVLACWSSPGRS